MRFGQNWLLIAGLVLTVLGIGYFLKYSFDQNWVGPAGRVAMAFSVGAMFLGAGEFFRRKDFQLFGLYLIGGGIAMFYFSTFAGFQIYHLISQNNAFGIMVLITVLAGALALVYDTKWLAVLGLIGGFLTPVILSTREDHQIGLMTYMMILNAGILTIAFFKQWRLLNYLGFIFTWLLFSGWFVQHYEVAKFWPTTVFLNLFFLTYSCVPFVFYFVKERGGTVGGFAITMPNAFIAFGYSFYTIKQYGSLQAVSIVSVIYAALFLTMATYLYQRKPQSVEAFVFLLAKAVLFLVITVPVLFSKHWITVFWAAQAAVLLWAALRLKSESLYRGAAVLLLVSLAKFLFYDYAEVFGLRVWGLFYPGGFLPQCAERMITVAVLLGVLAAAVRMMQTSDAPFVRPAEPILIWIVFGALLFIALNIEVSAFFHEYASQAKFASISVLWTVFSIVLMILGFLHRKSSMRKVSITLFAATVLKVFLVDMENVRTPFRIISFIVLGLVLVGASYLYHRYKSVLLPAEGGAPGKDQ